MNGRLFEALDFINWFCTLLYLNKVFICGNHDTCLYKAHISGLPCNVHYLYNSAVIINSIKFYGIPMFMQDAASGSQVQLLH